LHCDCSLCLRCWRAEFPPETEDAFNLEQYDNTQFLLSRTTEKEAGAATADDGDDGDVKIGSKKRKAVTTSGQNKKDKVCTT